MNLCNQLGTSDWPADRIPAFMAEAFMLNITGVRENKNLSANYFTKFQIDFDGVCS